LEGGGCRPGLPCLCHCPPQTSLAELAALPQGAHANPLAGINLGVLLKRKERRTEAERGEEREKGGAGTEGIKGK